MPAVQDTPQSLHPNSVVHNCPWVVSSVDESAEVAASIPPFQVVCIGIRRHNYDQNYAGSLVSNIRMPTCFNYVPFERVAIIRLTHTPPLDFQPVGT